MTEKSVRKFGQNKWIWGRFKRPRTGFEVIKMDLIFSNHSYSVNDYYLYPVYIIYDLIDVIKYLIYNFNFLSNEDKISK